MQNQHRQERSISRKHSDTAAVAQPERVSSGDDDDDDDALADDGGGMRTSGHFPTEGGQRTSGKGKRN